MTAIKEKPECPSCKSCEDDDEWDVVMCNCGRWFCWNCGSVPEGICDECSKEFEHIQAEFKRIGGEG